MAIAILMPCFFLIFFWAMSEIPKPRTLYKREITKMLKQENIKVNDDFTVLESKNEEDLYFYRTQFKIELSEKDFSRLNISENDTLKNVKRKNGSISDTILIIRKKDNVLDFYKSQFNDD